MRRYLALWLPFLPTDRLRRRQERGSGAPDERPLVVVDKRRGALVIAAGDPAALRLGLVPGLALADARARIPDIAAVEAEPEAEERLILALAALCDRFTPLVALDPPHGLMLDITGCDHLFGNEGGLLDAVRRLAGRNGLRSR